MTDREVMQMALVHMGINQYSVAELAPHKVVMDFNSAMEALRVQLEQPEREPTCPECKAAVLYECVACSSNNYPPKPEQKPVAMEQCSFPSCQTTGGCVGACTRPIQPVSPQRKPLTKEMVHKLWGNTYDDTTDRAAFEVFARAIEAAHGIKEEP